MTRTETQSPHLLNVPEAVYGSETNLGDSTDHMFA